MFDRSETQSTESAPLAAFEKELRSDPNILESLNAGLIGKGVKIPGPHGPRELIYADYVASGRALKQVEQFVLEQVLPFYANSHTEASYWGGLHDTVARRSPPSYPAKVRRHPRRTRGHFFRLGRHVGAEQASSFAWCSE